MTRKQYTILRIIFVVMLLGTIGSLYIGGFGDPVANMQSGDRWNPANAIIPCDLCRYIRAFMYSALLISIVGIVRKDTGSIYHLVVLAIAGLGFCVYKYLLEMGAMSNGDNPFLCATGTADCAEAKPLYMGFVTLAFLGAVANIFVILCAYFFVLDSKKSFTPK